MAKVKSSSNKTIDFTVEEGSELFSLQEDTLKKFCLWRLPVCIVGCTEEIKVLQ